MEQNNPNNIQNKLDTQFISGSLSYPSYAGPQEQYLGSNKQMDTYKGLTDKDVQYKNFIIKTYGSFDEYLRKTKIITKGAVFDPKIDFSMDVTVITKDKFYKSDHISADEIILEAMSGICSFVYIKKNGNAGRTIGTLENTYIPSEQKKYRGTFFSPLPGAKICVWDIYKQRWNMMFMKKMIRFSKNDTTDLE
jgi:hypothetical protein